MGYGIRTFFEKSKMALFTNLFYGDLKLYSFEQFLKFDIFMKKKLEILFGNNNGFRDHDDGYPQLQLAGFEVDLVNEKENFNNFNNDIELTNEKNKNSTNEIEV